MNRGRSRDGGSAAAELALVTPVLMMLLMFVVAAARLTHTRLLVDAAAHQAARAASTATTPGAADRLARTTAGSELASAGVSCTALSVAVDTGSFRPGGQVTVRLGCTTDLSGLALLDLPGSRTLTASFTVPIDLWRPAGGPGAAP